mmetsp:Transcript_37016/g.57399  ORF Transcript_37016/g.57399 Transcript_37016/m.57399 type:complete len:218 (-) Transcript_37016:75-728(-)
MMQLDATASPADSARPWNVSAKTCTSHSGNGITDSVGLRPLRTCSQRMKRLNAMRRSAQTATAAKTSSAVDVSSRSDVHTRSHAVIDASSAVLFQRNTWKLAHCRLSDIALVSLGCPVGPPTRAVRARNCVCEISVIVGPDPTCPCDTPEPATALPEAPMTEAPTAEAPAAVLAAVETAATPVLMALMIEVPIEMVIMVEMVTEIVSASTTSSSPGS